MKKYIFKDKRELYNKCVEKEPLFFLGWKLGMALKRLLNIILIEFKIYNLRNYLKDRILIK